MTAWLVASTLLLLSLMGCEDRLEQRSRYAVKGLATAPAERVREQMTRVVSLGSYALVDIEQELQGADRAGRLRLVEAAGRIGDREAVAFLRHVARWDDEEAVRQEAARVVSSLGGK